MVFLENIQREKSKYKVSQRKVLLEKEYLFPLVKGSSIKPFGHDYQNIVVPFPYLESDHRRPISAEALAVKSPLLLAYYREHSALIKAQTEFSDRIRGANSGDFYGLARTGPYSFAESYVAFRDNTKWCATVISKQSMPWGEDKRFVFQNHAVSMCERTTGGFLTVEEAHYICAIFNAPIVEEFILAGSDTRSFKIRPPVYVPLYDAQNAKHYQLSQLSQEAHSHPEKIEEIRQEIQDIYLAVCGEKK